MILITGANGQLGRDFQKLFLEMGMDFIPTHHAEFTGYQLLDITKKNSLESFVDSKQIRLIINCAAYNNVDSAEAQQEQAVAINTVAPKHLAEFASLIGASFVTFSTDFVFDGLKGAPYNELDLPNPINTYGKSKLEGERLVLDANSSALVIRTSWVFGQGNQNFSKSVLNWSKSKKEMRIVDDQVSAPTYTKDLAVFTWDLLQAKQRGLFHLTNQGQASKYDQAQYILERVGWKGNLIRCKTEDFNLPAKRAKYTKMDSSAAERIVGRKMPHWQDAIDRFLEEMRQAGEL